MITLLQSFLSQGAVFFTGVSKFAKTSIFSGINNLNDISLKSEAAALLGYTNQEIKNNLMPYVDYAAYHLETSVDEVLQDMQRWYNGYQFSEEEIKVYNPFSILYFLRDKKFKNYWFASGTPSFLIGLLKKNYEDLEHIITTELSDENLGTFDIENIPLVPLLFQAGYLTISEYDKQTKKFRLKFPNYEVQESFTKYLITTLMQTSSANLDTTLMILRKAIDANDIDQFFMALKALFAHVPYLILKESYYHALFQFLLSLLSLESQSEVLTDKGRIDLVLISKTHIYLFELKLNKSPLQALDQIKEKRYFERYEYMGKKIVLVGVSFNIINDQMQLEWMQKQL